LINRPFLRAYFFFCATPSLSMVLPGVSMV
jgi:hypothetical protein